MEEQEGLKALSSAILDNARRRGDEILQSAQKRADSVLKQAHASAAAKRQTVVAEAQNDAERHKRQITSAAQLEGRRLLLAKREEIISRVTETARDRLRSSLGMEERRAALMKFIVEAVTILGGGGLTVRANQQDSQLLTSHFLAEAKRVIAANGLTCDLALGPSVDIAGGVIADKDRGRVICDNSFESRLERRQPTLRNEIWQILTGGTASSETEVA